MLGSRKGHSCHIIITDPASLQAVCAMYHTCEQECGAILFWQYMASLVGIPVWMALYLYLMTVFGMLG